MAVLRPEQRQQTQRITGELLHLIESSETPAEARELVRQVLHDVLGGLAMRVGRRRMSEAWTQQQPTLPGLPGLEVADAELPRQGQSGAGV